MTPPEIRNMVHAKVAELSRPAGAVIADETTLEALKFDSLDVVELQFLIELELSDTLNVGGPQLAFDDNVDAWTGRTTVGAIVARTQSIVARGLT